MISSLGDMLFLLQAATLGAIALVFAGIFYRLKLHPLAKYPGPVLGKLSDLYVTYHILRGNLHIVQRHLHQKYGPIVRVGPNRLTFETTTALHEIYTSHRVQKSAGYAAMNAIPGVSNAHTTIDKALHRLKRKAINPGFSEQFIRKFEGHILQNVDTFIDQLAPTPAEKGKNTEWSAPYNMSDRCKWVFIDIIGEFGFGQSFKLQTEDTNRGVSSSLKLGAVMAGVYGQMPELRRLGLHNYMKADDGWTPARHGKFCREMVEQRLRLARDAKADLFSFVHETKDLETGDVFKLDDIWAESRLFLYAGSETMATVLAGCFFYLTRFPETHKRLLAEVKSTFKSSSDIRLGAALSGCHYVRAVLDESMRVSPPVGIALWREVCEDDFVVDGVHIPRGVEVGVPLYHLFHSESVYPEPDLFIPERWLEVGGRFPEHLQGARAAFKPFSLGSRNCAGISLAYAEMTLLLAKTIWALDFKRTEGPKDHVGEGSPTGIPGRQIVDEFQLESYITSLHEGPYIQFQRRDPTA